MPNISPSIINRFVVATVIIYFQRYPGTAGTDAERGIANVPFTLRVDGSVVQNGTTGPDGRVILRFARNKIAMLEILGSTYEIHVKGSIEPLNSIKGAQQRLNMLGYELGSIDGTVGRRTDNATLNFQADNNLDTDGIVGTRTRNQLRTQVGE